MCFLRTVTDTNVCSDFSIIAVSVMKIMEPAPTHLSMAFKIGLEYKNQCIFVVCTNKTAIPYLLEMLHVDRL